MAQQLDIFDDSRDVGLRNDLAQALLDGDAVQARRIAGTLQAELGGDRVLGAAADLLEHLDWRAAHAGPGALDVQAVLQRGKQLDTVLTRAAADLLGSRSAVAWLSAQWHWLADRASGIAWDPHHADAHAAPMYLRAGAWQAAAEAVARVPSWRRIPQPLLWMVQARWRGDGAAAGWPLLAEALWLAPARAAALVPSLDHRQLRAITDRFEERFDPAAGSGGTWGWLPAFVLIEAPALASALASAEPPADNEAARGYRLVAALLRLERQGRHHEIVAHRAELKALSPPLFAAYMSTR